MLDMIAEKPGGRLSGHSLASGTLAGEGLAVCRLAAVGSQLVASVHAG